MRKKNFGGKFEEKGIWNPTFSKKFPYHTEQKEEIENIKKERARNFEENEYEKQKAINLEEEH